MKKLLFSMLFSSITILTYAQFTVNDPTALAQRQTQFANSLKQTIESLRIAKETYNTTKEGLAIYNEVSQSFMALSVINDISDNFSRVITNYERTKSYINNQDLYPEEKTLYMTRLTALLGDAVNNSNDFKTLITSDFKSDASGRLAVLRTVNTSLNDINSNISSISNSAKLKIRNRKSKTLMHKRIFLGY